MPVVPFALEPAIAAYREHQVDGTAGRNRRGD
jgi:hypothetical protein